MENKHGILQNLNNIKVKAIAIKNKGEMRKRSHRIDGVYYKVNKKERS